MKKNKGKSLFSGFSLTFRISLAITLLITTLMGAVGISTYVRDRNAFLEEATNRGWTTVNAVNTFAAAHMREQNYVLLNELVRNLKQDNFIVQATVVDKTGIIVADEDETRVGQLMKSTMLAETMKNNKEQVNTIKDDQGKTIGLNFMIPITDATKQVFGYFQLTADLTYVYYHLQQTAHNILLNFVLASLAGLILTRLIVLRHVHRPVQAIMTATEKVATGDFSGQLPVTTRDELGRLSQAFNGMTGHLGVLFDNVRHTVSDIGQTSLLIVERSDINEKKSIESIDPRQQKELLKQINSSAKRLARMSDKLNSLAMQFKTEP